MPFEIGARGFICNTFTWLVPLNLIKDMGLKIFLVLDLLLELNI